MFVAPKTGGLVGWKGSLSAPLFVLALGFSFWSSSEAYVTPWAISVLMLGVVAWMVGESAVRWTWVFVAVAGYALVAIVHSLLVSSAYTPAGIYHPLLVVASFLALRTAGPGVERHAVLVGVAFTLALAAWGLLEIVWLSTARAHALFVTPSTYGAVINFLLVPMVTMVLFGRREPLVVATVAVLAMGLLAADSRGAMLAAAAGTGLGAILALRARVLRLRHVLVVTSLLAAAAVAVAVIRFVAPYEESRPGEPAPSAEMRAESSLARLELYALSWDAWREAPITGSGYLTFRYVQEQGRTRAPSFGESRQTWFVHNDYLQTLQELGLAGLAALLGMTVVPLLWAYARIANLGPADQAFAAAAASAAASTAVHALVDFPFYVPACLLLYGAALGVLDKRLSPMPGRADRPSAGIPGLAIARPLGIALALVILGRPLAAEWAADWGIRKLSQGEGQEAAFWLGAATRIDGADWRYHWYAGRFWESQALQSGRRAAARLAAEAYAAGFESNPLEVENLLGRISVHLRLRTLLDAPADRDTLLAWVMQAGSLAPLHPGVAQARAAIEAAQ